jgi:hypothetical protein
MLWAQLIVFALMFLRLGITLSDDAKKKDKSERIGGVLGSFIACGIMLFLLACAGAFNQIVRWPLQ